MNKEEKKFHLDLLEDTRNIYTEWVDQLQQKVNQLETNRDEAKEEIKDLLEHWKGNDLVERDLNTLLSILERGKE